VPASELSPISGNKRRQNLFGWSATPAVRHLFQAERKKPFPPIPSKLLITRRHEGACAAHTRHAFFKVELLGSLLTFHLLTSFLDYSRLPPPCSQEKSFSSLVQVSALIFGIPVGGNAEVFGFSHFHWDSAKTLTRSTSHKLIFWLNCLLSAGQSIAVDGTETLNLLVVNRLFDQIDIRPGCHAIPQMYTVGSLLIANVSWN
jgi:hypothetical protein